MTQITETFYQEKTLAERVDAAAGVIRGVKLLGEASKNKRRYTKKAMKEAAPLYNGAQAFVDHPERDKLSEDRKIRDLAGVYENARYEEGRGIFADLKLVQSGDYFRGIIELAQKFPTSVGLSHVAEGESHHEDGEEIVESIREVFSVDLVASPATTAGFFESFQKRCELREATETLPADHPLRTRLIEMIDSGYAASSGGEPKDEQPADQNSQLTTILRDAIAALSDSLKALAKANKPAPPVVAPPGTPPTDKPEEGAEDEDEEMSPEDKEKIAAFEGLQRENAELKASKLLLESGRQATPARMKALANCSTDAEQQELLESWPKIGDGRPAGSPPLVESEDFTRGDSKKFAAMLR